VALFFLQHRSEGRVSIDGSKQSRFLYLFVLAVLLSIPLAYWGSKAIEGFVDIIKILVFYVLVVHLVNTRKRLKDFVWTFSLLTAYLAGNSLYAYFTGNLKFAQGIERAVGQTSAGGDPNHLGATMASAFPLFFLLVRQKALGWKRITFAGGLPLLIITMSITGSRSALLGFLGCAVYLWWTSSRRVMFGIVGLSILVGGYLLLPQQYQQRYSTMTETELDASSQSRINTWKAGIRMIMDRPLFGVGIRCFGVAHGMNYSPSYQRSWLESHNLYLQVPAEIGLVGALFFFAFLIEFLRLNRRTAKLLANHDSDWSYEQTVLRAVFAGCIVLLITGVFGHSLTRRTWYLYGALGLATFRIYLDYITNLPHPSLKQEASKKTGHLPTDTSAGGQKTT